MDYSTISIDQFKEHIIDLSKKDKTAIKIKIEELKLNLYTKIENIAEEIIKFKNERDDYIDKMQIIYDLWNNMVDNVDEKINCDEEHTIVETKPKKTKKDKIKEDIKEDVKEDVKEEIIEPIKSKKSKKIKEEVIKEEVIKEEVIKEEVIKEEVIKEEVIKEKSKSKKIKEEIIEEKPIEEKIIKEKKVSKKIK